MLSGIFHNLIIQEIAIRLSNDNDVWELHMLLQAVKSFFSLNAFWFLYVFFSHLNHFQLTIILGCTYGIFTDIVVFFFICRVVKIMALLHWNRPLLLKLLDLIHQWADPIVLKMWVSDSYLSELYIQIQLPFTKGNNNLRSPCVVQQSLVMLFENVWLDHFEILPLGFSSANFPNVEI